MKRTIRASSSGPLDIASELRKRFEPDQLSLINPDSAVVLSLGNATTGYAYIEGGRVFLVESTEQAKAYNSVDEFLDRVADTWR